MSNRGQHNRHQHNRGGFSAVAGSRHPYTAYRLEARTSSGALTALLPYWSNATAKWNLDEHGDLSFQYPFTTANWSLFNFPAQIWLRDDRGNLMERYHITSRKRVRDDSGHVSIHVTGASLLYQLSREEITNYETGNEIQTVTVSATGGTYTLKFRGYTTGNIAYNASAATIQTALEGLTSIGSGNVAVSGSGPYTIEFQGALAETDVAQLVPNGASLTGSSRKATVATTRTSKTVREVIQNWLTGWQLNSKPITFGYVDPSIGNTTTTIRVENKSILAAIRELQQTYGGVIWVDPSSRRLYWRREQGGRTGQYVKIGKNGQGIEETEDFAGLCTRVIAVGAGDTYETALRVTVNDSTAQSAYDIIPATIVNKSIWDTTTLTAWATANLNARKTPRKTYNVGIIDLARLTSADYSFFDLSIGSYIRVIDTELGLSLDTKIVSIERNLDNPLDVKIQVSNPSAGVDGNESAAIVPRERSLEDTIADLFDGLQDQWGDTGFLDALNDALPQSMTTTSSPAAQQVTNIVNSAVADGTIAVPSKGTSIQSVGTANSAGSNSTFAADDHVHKGNHFNATDVAGLPSLAEGNTFHLTGSTKRFGCYVNSLNQILSHV